MLVAPSVLAADFSKLAEELRSVEEAGADLVHLDVMDGHFVPNLTFGPVVVKGMRKLSRLPFEAHLMISEPARYARRFAEAGVQWLTFHVESEGWSEALEEAGRLGLKRGLALNPETPLSAVEPHLEELDLVLVMSVHPGFSGQRFIPEVLPKIERLREIKEREGLGFLIGVDGGINPETAPLVARAGAELVAVGSAFFKAPDRAELVKFLKSL